MRVLLSLVLALGMRLVYAVPAQAVVEQAAVSHCTQHTGRPASLPAARHCCQVSTEADAPATTPAVPHLPASHLLALPGILSALPALAPCDAPRPTIASTRDGPPRYLALRSIRR